MGPFASFADARAAVWRQAWLMLLVLALGLPAAYWYAKTRPSEYEAVAVVQIEAPEVAEAAVGGGGAAMLGNAQIDAIQQSLTSRDSLLGLADEFGLFAEIESETLRLAMMRGSITLTEIIDPTQAWRPDVQPSGVILRVRLGEAQAAADLANALARRLVAAATARATERTAATLEFLVAEEARVAAQIAAIEGQIADFRATNLASLPEGVTAQRERRTSLEEDIVALERRAIEAAGTADRLRPEEAERQRNLLEEERRLLVAALDEVEMALAAAPAVERELGALERRLGQLESELSVVTARRTEAAMNQTLQTQERTGRFSVLEPAVVPEFAVSPSRRNIAIAGGVAVGFLALGLALARELLEPSIRSAAQLRRQLGVEPLVVIPRLTTRPGRRRRRFALLGGLAALLAGAWVVGRGGAQRFVDILPRASS
jgi:uncharacterized protein involved in exopolysaccharide biosynthesis